MTLSLKVYVDYGCENQEIRRFSTDNQSWKNLDQKFRQLFPKLDEGGFAVYWTDEDGEFVSITSDEELAVAIRNSGDLLKLYIKTFPKEDGESQPGEKCDGCEARIAGLGYRCLICPDFDICPPCEAQGLHGEHDMVGFHAPQISSRFGFTRGRRCLGRGWSRGRACGRGLGWRGRARGRPCGIRGEFSFGGFADGMPGFHPPFHPFFQAWFNTAENEEASASQKNSDEPVPAESDEDMARCLSQMEAMGYRDDAGWLTILIKEKNYNLDKILEAIHPQETSQSMDITNHIVDKDTSE